MQAVILAGGFGTRLAHVVSDVPKPMAPIGDVPFLSYQIEQLRAGGFDDFILLTGYMSEVVEQYFSGDTQIKCIKENTPLGTGGAILNAYSLLKDEFWVINGDTFFDIDFSIMRDFATDKNVVIALRYSKDIDRYGLVDIQDNFLIQSFSEKGDLPDNQIDGYINGGIYYFKKKSLAEEYHLFKNQNISLENEIFPKLLKKGEMYGLPLGGAFIDIGIPEDYRYAQTYIPETIKKNKSQVVFVDKDGTLIVNTGYPHGREFSIIDETREILQEYASKGYKFVLITNQAGIAKGKFTKAEMDENIMLIQKCYEKYNIFFEDIEYCPYHPEAVIPEYRYISKARKPEAGMILRSCEKLRIDLKSSIMLGDNPLVDKIKLPYLKSVILGEENV